MVGESVTPVIQRYLERLAAAGLPISRAILFGSRARGAAPTDDSDIDVLLLSPAFDNLTWSQEALAWEIAQSLDWRIEPVLCGESWYEENDWHPLIDVAKHEGVEIPIRKEASTA